MWLRPTTASTPAAKATARLRYSQHTPYGYIPNKITSTSPILMALRSARSEQSAAEPVHQVLLPVYSVVSVGGDTNFTNNMEYRIPIAGPVTFAFFDDFGIDLP
jgi:outer membrane protein insertion porin family